MTFKIGDKVRLNTKKPFFGYAHQKTLSEIGTIVSQPKASEWYIDFPSHDGFRILDSEIELVKGASTGTAKEALKVPTHPKTVKLRIVRGKPPDSSIKTPQPQTDEIIRQWKLDKSLQLETLAADFYSLIDLQCDCPKEPQINIPLEKLTTQLADQFSAYLDMVIGGELRHARYRIISDCDTDECYPCIDDMPLSQPAKDILYAFQGHYESGDRGGAWEEWKAIREELGIKALKSAREIFHSDWEGGYGGESWARATAILMGYLGGTLSATAFVDTCFGLHHNNNIILDKVWRIKIDLVRVLDYNRDNEMPDVASYCSPQVKALIWRFRK